MDTTKTYKVTNRSAGMAVYNIPEARIRRSFASGETKMIPLDEIRLLSYQPGGPQMLMNFLQVEPVVAEELGMSTEPEYNLSIEEVKELLEKGSQDAFLDALDFAPTGVIELIKKFAVELPLSDMNKVAAWKEKTGFDVLAALNHIAEDKAEVNTAPAQPAQRRTKIEKAEDSTPQRRTIVKK